MRSSLDGSHSRDSTSTSDIIDQGISSRPRGIADSRNSTKPSFLRIVKPSQAPPNKRVRSTLTREASTSTQRGLVSSKRARLPNMIGVARRHLPHPDPTRLVQIAQMSNHSLARTPLCPVALHQLPISVILAVLLLLASSQEHSPILQQNAR